MKKIVFAFFFVLTGVGAWSEHKPERDPFVQLGQRQTTTVETVTHKKTPAMRPVARQQPAPRTVKFAPKLNVLGLVTSSRQPRALLTGEKNTFIVAEGDKLGDYRVAKIDRSGVTLAFKRDYYNAIILH